MNAASPSPAPSPENLAQLDAARRAAQKIRRAVSVANFDGWTIGGFAAITIAFSITTPSGIILGLGMTYVAWRELSSGAALRRLDIAAPRRLAMNQIVLCALLTLYFGWSLYQAVTEPSTDFSEVIGQMPEAKGMAGLFYGLLYGGLIVASVVAQGLSAWYYVSRTRLLTDYLATTPQWIIDYQRGGGTL